MHDELKHILKIATVKNRLETPSLTTLLENCERETAKEKYNNYEREKEMFEVNNLDYILIV